LGGNGGTFYLRRMATQGLDGVLASVGADIEALVARDVARQEKETKKASGSASASAESAPRATLAGVARRAAEKWRAVEGKETRAAQTLQKTIIRLHTPLAEAADALKGKGNAALAENDLVGAVCWFEAGLALQPKSHVLWSNQSAAFAAGGEYSLALQSAEHCVLSNSQWAKGYSRKGLALFHLGRHEDALVAYKQGLELEPDNQAITAAVKQTELASHAAEFNVLGEENLNRNKYSVAADFFMKATLRDNTNRVYWANYAEALLGLNRYAEALDAADNAIRLQPTWAKAIIKRATALRALNRFEEAAATYNHLSALYPNEQSYRKLVVDMQTEGMRYRARQNMADKTDDSDKK
jgi:tetratricopeptide (TPR) repeat protein